MTVCMDKLFTENMSTTAKGIFLMMSRIPDRDYSTLDEIYSYDTITPVEESEMAVQELLSKSYLFKVKNKNENQIRYAVNKVFACTLTKTDVEVWGEEET